MKQLLFCDVGAKVRLRMAAVKVVLYPGRIPEHWRQLDEVTVTVIGPDDAFRDFVVVEDERQTQRALTGELSVIEGWA
jgi:hypothetical protein